MTGNPSGLSVWALPGIPEIRAGDDLVGVVLASIALDGRPLADGDVLVVTSKIVSKAEGRAIRALDREAAIDAETVRVVASRTGKDGRVTRIVENRLGVVGAAAGVDASNTAPGTVLLLPEDPDRSARELAEALRTRTGARLGVIVSDTLGRAWRDGQTDIAIGAAGVHVFDDLRGRVDSAGRPLRVTRPCLADELAAAADLVKGKTGGFPVAVVRGLPGAVGDLDLPGASSIIREAASDLFRLGSAEAERLGYERGYRDAQAAKVPTTPEAD
ncbi:coenzyme F420-0:L-glutamate ligase [Propionicimonas sp.]|uniref:coenzyme F420-0:L-glutamate ligase n=1 Tax=Propionicimonas sp. TaxID=1955623 RepID=UPI0039E34FC3